VIGAADQRHAGLASGVNSAVARIAGLLAVALSTLAVAAVVGGDAAVGGDVLSASDPAAFHRGFRFAMLAAGAAAAVGGVVVGASLGRTPRASGT